MIFNALTILIILLSLFGITNKRFNLIGIFLCSNMMIIAITINLIIFGAIKSNQDIIMIGFFSMIIISCLNSVIIAIIYNYFEKKNSLEPKESLRDE
ncbi:MAG: NADH:ubiquinone oxidoreductase subunit K [Alphaproteobacteria bacterium ADurb.Bin438]|nr:MAG: NADH:ubiquinone oxidoreductase subunit K [Alphaproteobacteria bacterium ADurb.Bin438]